MNISQEILRVIDEALNLNGRSATFGPQSQFLGAVPELDSMAIVTLITSLEERFDLIIDDDEIDGSTFSTIGSLTDFISEKIAA